MSYAEAFEPAPPNEWVRPWARVVLGTLILMGVAGWVFGPGTIPFKMGMCAVTAVIEIWGFNAAVQWSRALSRMRAGFPLAYWSGLVIACAGWTIFSLYHALGLIAGDMGAAATPAYVAFTCLALCLPFHEWAIDRVETAPKKQMAEAVSHAPPRDVAKAVAKELSRQTPRSASKRRGDASEERVASRAPPLSEQELRQAVSEMTQQGEVISIRKVAKHLDVPPSRVERSPARHVLRAVA